MNTMRLLELCGAVIEAMVLWMIKGAAAECSLDLLWSHLSVPQQSALCRFWYDSEALVEKRLESLGFWYDDTEGPF